MSATYGPPEARVRWVPDNDPLELGDIPWEHWEPEVNAYGVWGCVIEVRQPACACCGRKNWEHGPSLWGIVGDDAYHREVERDLLAEVMS